MMSLVKMLGLIPTDSRKISHGIFHGINHSCVFNYLNINCFISQFTIEWE